LINSRGDFNNSHLYYQNALKTEVQNINIIVAFKNMFNVLQIIANYMRMRLSGNHGDSR